MPYSTRPYALQLHALILEQDTAYALWLKEQLQGADTRLREVVKTIMDDLYETTPRKPFDPRRWENRQWSYFRRLATPITDAYDNAARRSRTHVRDGFFLSAKHWQGLISALYPAKYIPRQEAEIKLAFGDRDALRKEWLAFQGKMLDSGTEPAALIRTLSQEHVKLVQGAMIEGMGQGQSLRWVKDKAVEAITGRVVSPDDIRLPMEANVMRIVRTSYSQAVNADIMAFGDRNSDLVSHYIRVVDGRPCLSCLPPEAPIKVPSGRTVPIDGIKVGDRVVSHSKEPRKVTQIMSRYHQGEMISVLVGDRDLRLTPEHPVLTQRGWVEAGKLSLQDRVCCG